MSIPLDLCDHMGFHGPSSLRYLLQQRSRVGEADVGDGTVQAPGDLVDAAMVVYLHLRAQIGYTSYPDEVLEMTTVFVSATSTDLAECRQSVRDILLTHDILPKLQEHFPPDYHDLRESLREKIASCDAVICLVGCVLGAVPSGAATPRSYTQIEYDMACELGKPAFIFLTSDTFPHSGAEPAENLRLQRQHRETLLERHKCEFFSTLEDLRLKVAHAVPALLQLSGHRPMFYLHPPTTPPYFSGRHTELCQLHDAMRAHTPATIVVVGMGGQGKTTLVRQAIERAPSFPFAWGFWCTAHRGGLSFDDFLDEILQYFTNGKFDKREMPSLEERSRRLLRILQERPALIVIDGIERWLCGWSSDTNATQTGQTAEQRRGQSATLDDFLQSVSGLSNGTHLVLTTRALPGALDYAACATVPVRSPGEDLRLEGLTDDAAVALLRRLGVHGSDDSLKEAAAGYGNHPLALEVLAGLLVEGEGGQVERAPQVSLLDPQRRLFELFDTVRRQLPGVRDAERFLQIASLCLEDPSLATLAAVIFDRQHRGILAPFRRAKSVPSASAQEASLQATAVVLSQWNLLVWDGTTKRVSFHPLVREFFAKNVRNPRRIHERLMCWYAAQPVPQKPRTLEHTRTHNLAVEHAWRAGDIEQCASLMFGPFVSPYTYCEWLAVWGHLTHGIELLERLAGTTNVSQRAEFLIARAAMLYRLRRLEPAVHDLDAAINDLRHAAGGTPGQLLNLARALGNRANVLRDLGRPDDSVHDLSEAVKILQAVSELNGARNLQLDLARTLVNRGNAYSDLGCWANALNDHKQAIEMLQCLLLISPDPVLALQLLAQVAVNIGVILSQKTEFESAVNQLKSAEQTYVQLIEQEHEEFLPDLARTRIILAEQLHHLDDTAQSRAVIDRAVVDLERLRDAGRSDIESWLALALTKRAYVRIAAGCIEDANDDADRAIAAYQRCADERAEENRQSLARALLVRAEARYRLNQPELSAADRRNGLNALRDLVAGCAKDAEVRVAFWDCVHEAIKYLLPRDKPESDTLAHELLSDLQRVLANDGTCEALSHAATRIVESLRVTVPDVVGGYFPECLHA